MQLTETAKKSRFFAPERVELLKADVVAQAEQSQLRFSLSAGFAVDAAQAMRSSLLRLGAEGMARRMEVLVREGLVN